MLLALMLRHTGSPACGASTTTLIFPCPPIAHGTVMEALTAVATSLFKTAFGDLHDTRQKLASIGLARQSWPCQVIVTTARHSWTVLGKYFQPQSKGFLAGLCGQWRGHHLVFSQ